MQSWGHRSAETWEQPEKERAAGLPERHFMWKESLAFEKSSPENRDTGLPGCLAGHTFHQVEGDSSKSNQKVKGESGFLWINQACCKPSRWPLLHHSSPFPELLSVYWWRNLANQLASTLGHGLTPSPALRTPLVTRACLGQGLAL